MAQAQLEKLTTDVFNALVQSTASELAKVPGLLNQLENMAAGADQATRTRIDQVVRKVRDNFPAFENRIRAEAGPVSGGSAPSGGGDDKSECPSKSSIENGVRYPPGFTTDPNKGSIRAERHFADFASAMRIKLVQDDGSPVLNPDGTRAQVLPLLSMETAVLPMSYPDSAKSQGQKPQNILVYGPGGTGKTSSINALCYDNRLIMVQVDGASLKGAYVGQSEKCLTFATDLSKDLAKQTFWNRGSKDARGVALFIDEIDGILAAKEASGVALVQHFKSLIQVGNSYNFNDQGCLVIGATNNPQGFEQAVKDRFPIKIYFGTPDMQARIDFFIESIFERASINGCGEGHTAPGAFGTNMHLTYPQYLQFFRRVLSIASHFEPSELSSILADQTKNGQLMNLVHTSIEESLERFGVPKTVSFTDSADRSNYAGDLADLYMTQIETKREAGLLLLNPEMEAAVSLVQTTPSFSQRNLNTVFTQAEIYSPNSWVKLTSSLSKKGPEAQRAMFCKKNLRTGAKGETDDRYVPSDLTGCPGAISYGQIEDLTKVCFKPLTFQELLYPVANSLVRSNTQPKDLDNFFDFALEDNDRLAMSSVAQCAAEMYWNRPSTSTFRNPVLRDMITGLVDQLKWGPRLGQQVPAGPKAVPRTQINEGPNLPPQA